MQIVIIGMHRSGTSAVTRLVNMMGAYFGMEAEATYPNQENPRGFWERKDIRKINDNLLIGNGFDWNRIAQFDVDELGEQSIQEYRTQFKKIILKLDAHRPWVIKEPRFSLLFPHFENLLPSPVIILVYRNPIEVACSLEKRNAMPLTVGLALWEKYNMLSLAALNRHKCLFVSYAELMQDPCQLVNRLYQELTRHDVAGLRLPADKEITNFISSDLYREKADQQLITTNLNKNQLELYAACQSRSTVNIPDRISLAAQASLEQYEIMMNDVNRIGELTGQLSQANKLRQELKAQNQAVIDKLENQIRLQGLELNAQNKKINSMQTQLAQAVQTGKDLGRQLNLLTSSRTWKIGRFIVNFIRAATFRKPQVAASQLKAQQSAAKLNDS